MARRNNATHHSTAPPAPAPFPGLQIAPTDPILIVLRRAAWHCLALLRSAVPACVRIEIKLEFELNSFVTNEGEAIEFDDEVADPAPAGEPEAGIPILEGEPAAPVPLMGSLHGLLAHHEE